MQWHNIQIVVGLINLLLMWIILMELLPGSKIQILKVVGLWWNLLKVSILSSVRLILIKFSIRNLLTKFVLVKVGPVVIILLLMVIRIINIVA